jgi:hypothetical protein
MKQAEKKGRDAVSKTWLFPKSNDRLRVGRANVHLFMDGHELKCRQASTPAAGSGDPYKQI